ncbi:MAG: hypothetical protein H6818_04650 [Phycisphaerales bacterium]|nr:hypothetical protein [Phycisphaerales bacterium]
MAMIAEGQIAYSVLMLIGSAGPVAIYFLSLGLVNCHARPCLISARSDFIALSVVLAPLLLWSLPVAIQFGSGWMLGLAAIVLAVIFRKLVPGRNEGFVLYNVSRQIGHELIQATLSNKEAAFRRESETAWVSLDGRVRVTASTFALLRSVSIQVEGESRQIASAARRLRDGLERNLSRVEQLPSAVGAGLVLAGVGIAVVPMWLVTRHIQDLVEVVASLFG